MFKEKTRSTLRISLCLLLMLAAVFCLGAIKANAEEVAAVSEPAVIASGTCGADGDNLTWVLTDDGKLTISGSGAMADYSSGKAPWYSKKNSIISLEIGDSVTSIGSYAFCYCNKLTSVEIPDSVTSIGRNAFYYCFGLTGELIIPDSVTSIGYSAFSDCRGLTSVEIPDSVTSIGSNAFSFCYGLTSVVIGDSVTSIGNYAFSYCDKLVEVINRSSLNITKGSSDNGSVGYYAKEIHNGESKIIDKDGFLFYTYDGTNYLLGYNDIASVTELILPDDYNGESYEIYDRAFYYCSGLTGDLIIPDRVTSIGYRAFEYCDGLTSVEIGDSVTSIGNSAFENCDGLTSVVIGGSVTSIGDYAFCDCRGLTSVVIGDSVTSIGSSAFSGCGGLTSVVIGDSVTSIGSSAFSYCIGLTSVEIGDSVTSIGEGAFYQCEGLKSIVIPDSVTSIGSSAFSYCIGLKSVVIPDSVTSIGSDAFRSCYGLTSVEIGDSVTSIGSSAFENCDELTSVTFKNPNGWWYASEADATSGTAISANNLSNTATAARYLTSTYYSYYWKAHRHTYNAVVTLPTCTEIGYTTYTCDCGDSYVGDEVAATGHTYDAVVTPPTCVDGGYTTHICACGDSYVSDEVAALGHSYNAVVTDPNCVNSGYTTYTCACGENYVSDHTQPTGIHKLQNGACVYCGIPGSGTCGKDLNWVITDDGVLTVSGSGFMDDFASKSETPWSAYRTAVTKVVIGEGVQYVGSYAFSEFTVLNEVSLPSTLLSLGEHSFSKTSKVKSITLPASLISVGRKSFYGSGIAEAIFENTAGWYVGGTVAISIPDAATAANYLKTVYNDAFLIRDTSVTPEIGEEIDGGSFNWSVSSTGILTLSGKGEMPTYPTGKTPWAKYKSMIVEVVIEEGITSVSHAAFYEFTSIRRISLPTSLTVIGNYAFYSCSAVERMEIPENVEYIGQFAFRRCGASEIVFLAYEGKSSGTGLWCVGETVFEVGEFSPSGAAQYLKVGYYKEIWTLDKTKTWTIAEGERIIANGFCGVANHTDQKWSLTEDGTLTISGMGAMKEFTSEGAPWSVYKDMIVSVVIEEGITSVGKNAFYEHKAITAVSLPSTLVRIEQYAFYNCTALTEMTVPAGVNYIGAYALRKAGLNSLVFEDTRGWDYNGNAVSSGTMSDSAAIAEQFKKVNYSAAWNKSEVAAYERDGDKIYFGSYPQTEVTDESLISTLNGMAGTLPTSDDSQNWTSYGYYESGSISNDMWYIDVEADGDKYRGVYFTSYRPYNPGNSSSLNNCRQDDNGYTISTVYWFKYEPIGWTILSENTADGTALILCDMIIDSQSYDYDNGSYDNNYANSTIRKWLNETFYNTAFNDLQKAIILTTTVDNSVASTGYSSNPYACEDTNDKIFLLSYKEVTNSAYGFLIASTNDEARSKKTTDYAQVQGAYTSTYSSYSGNGFWWLRSPNDYDSGIARGLSYDGCGTLISGVYMTYEGVVPALQIRL